MSFVIFTMFAEGFYEKYVKAKVNSYFYSARMHEISGSKKKIVVL